MKNSAAFIVKDDNGNEHSCLLTGKDNNENGEMLYTFRNESSGSLFTISKNNGVWNYVNGDLPQKDCIAKLGDFLEQSEN